MTSPPSSPFWALTALLVVLFASAGWITRSWFLHPGPSPHSDSGDAVNRSFVEDVVLDKEQREFIWNVEHEVLVVNGFGFKDLSQAIAKADEQALASFLGDGFTGRRMNQPRETALNQDFAQVVRLEDSGASPVEQSRAEFIAQLMQYRKIFAKEPKVSIKAKNLNPVVRGDYEGEWQGTALFRMWGEAEQQQPAEVALQLTYRIAHPVKEHNRKGWIYSCGATQSQVSKAKRFLLKDVTLERGVDAKRYHDNWTSTEKPSVTGGIYLLDFNRDGIPDMLITDMQNFTLYQGLPGGKLIDVTKEMGLPVNMQYFEAARFPSWATGVIDIDGDGWEDLILMGQVFRNDGGKRFVSYADKCNLALPPDVSNMAVADFDRDGKMDFYVTRAGVGKSASWVDGLSGHTEGNQLWRNLGNWQFENVTDVCGVSGGSRSTFSAVWLDANNDGWPDLYVPNEFGNGILLLNQGKGTGKFKEHALANGPSDFGTMGITAGDIDNDGNIDLFMANMFSKAGRRIVSNLKPDSYPPEIMAKLRRLVDGNQLYLNRGDLKFDALGKQLAVHDVGWAYGPNLIDLDNDGFLDIYSTTGYISVNRHEPDG